jgi:undecaprenyl-diphosphatase
MDELIKICAKYLVVVPVLVSIYIFWKLDKKSRKQMILIGIGGAVLSLVLAKLSSHLYTDIRPQFKDGSIPLLAHGNDNGFPSDHTLLASFLALLAITYSKRTGYGLLAVALIIGWARVAAHIHHAVDIAGSLVITAVAYAIAVKLVNRYLESGKES